MENQEIIKKDTTKEKIILFIIGVLVGAVISTGAFFAYIKLAGVNNSGQSMQMPGGTPPEMPSGEGGQLTTPPEKPNDESNSDSTEKQNNQNDTSSSGTDKNNKSKSTNS